MHTGHDALYMPEERGSDIYKKLPLEFDGTHYLLPFVVLDDSPSEQHVCRQQTLEEYPNGAARVWMSWVPLAGVRSDRPCSNLKEGGRTLGDLRSARVLAKLGDKFPYIKKILPSLLSKQSRTAHSTEARHSSEAFMEEEGSSGTRGVRRQGADGSTCSFPLRVS